MSRPSITAPLALVLLGLLVQTANSCPFCNAVSQTFSEEIAAMDVVVMAQLVESPAAHEEVSPDPDAEPAKSKFQITEIIKGQEILGESRTIETLFFGVPNLGKTYLIMGADPPDLMWSSPFEISERAQAYIRRVTQLPAGPERLEFFLEYLEDKDEVLTRDAYDEFARAPYGDVVALKSAMDHDQLVAWITDAGVPSSRRRLYLTMLGIRGTADDLPMLEKLLRSDEPVAKEGRDALVACYLMLKGPEGLPLVEQLFLTNETAEYVDTYATIMALRFHGTEADIIPRERLLEALRHVLQRPELADLVISDFARWEDWSVMDRLVELFKNADEQSNWARVPVINYLRACPLPEAKAHIRALEQIDPEAVKRANTFFPFATAVPATRQEADAMQEASSGDGQPASASQAPPGLAQDEAVPAAPANTAPPESEMVDGTVDRQPTAADRAEPLVDQSVPRQRQQSTGQSPDAANGDGLPADARSTPPPDGRRVIDTAPLARGTFLNINVVPLLGLALLLGVFLLLAMWLVLRGAKVHSKF